MDDSQTQAVALSLCEPAAFAERAAAPAAPFDRGDLRLFAGAFVAGFLFFLTWLS